MTLLAGGAVDIRSLAARVGGDKSTLRAVGNAATVLENRPSRRTGGTGIRHTGGRASGAVWVAFLATAFVLERTDRTLRDASTFMCQSGTALLAMLAVANARLARRVAA